MIVGGSRCAGDPKVSVSMNSWRGDWCGSARFSCSGSSGCGSSCSSATISEIESDWGS